MPYIKQDRRHDLDLIVKLMKEVEVMANGDLNYILYAFCKRHTPLNYNSIKNYIGELNETIAEIRRTILADYEDQKKKENGSIL